MVFAVMCFALIWGIYSSGFYRKSNMALKNAKFIAISL